MNIKHYAVPQIGRWHFFEGLLTYIFVDGKQLNSVLSPEWKQSEFPVGENAFIKLIITSPCTRSEKMV